MPSNYHCPLMTSLLKLMKIAAVLLSLLLSAGQMQAQSALDGFDPNAGSTGFGYSSVRVVVFQPDGKILIGGHFTTLSPNGGAAVARKSSPG